MYKLKHIPTGREVDLISAEADPVSFGIPKNRHAYIELTVRDGGTPMAKLRSRADYELTMNGSAMRFHAYLTKLSRRDGDTAVMRLWVDDVSSMT